MLYVGRAVLLSGDPPYPLRTLFYLPAPALYPAYVEVRDPVLGWKIYFYHSQLDELGERITPAFPDPRAQPAMISLYGDSFTFSPGVLPEESYANVLSKLVGRRVNNFGVGGYGTDQAYLRFKTQRNDPAGVVILGHLSDNVMRNVNQFHDLIGSLGQPACMFKPRFLVDGKGNLQLVPVVDYTA